VTGRLIERVGVAPLVVVVSGVALVAVLAQILASGWWPLVAGVVLHGVAPAAHGDRLSPEITLGGAAGVATAMVSTL
jgi:hypothetical protein